MTGPNPGPQQVGGAGVDHRHRLRPPAAIRWSVRSAVFTYVAAGLLSSGSFAAVGGGDVTDVTVAMHAAGLLGLWSALMAGVMLCTYTRGTGSLVDDIALRWRPADLAVGALAGVFLQVAVTPLIAWPIELLTGADVERPARELLQTDGPKWILVVLITVGAPIVEEIFYRGVLLRALARRFDDVPAMIVGSALFGASHFQLAQLPGLFAVGLVLSALVRRTGRLGASIIAHMCFNATAVWILT